MYKIIRITPFYSSATSGSGQPVRRSGAEEEATEPAKYTTIKHL